MRAPLDALIPAAYHGNGRQEPGRPPALTLGPDAMGGPAPLLESVGDIPGLSPRRGRGDGDTTAGEVPGADVDLVDALPAPARRRPGRPWRAGCRRPARLAPAAPGSPTPRRSCAGWRQPRSAPGCGRSPRTP
ncbi:hypothetical protein OHR68_13650 [Spirillospora sp. NBC_00431]